jgi:hypothetical protein
MSIIFHADVHNDETFAPMWRNLLERAQKRQLILLCDGSCWNPKGATIRRPPDIDWQGDTRYINGLESASSAAGTWAEAVIVVGSCKPVTNTFSQCGADGMQAVRILCRASLQLNLPIFPEISQFIDGLNVELDSHNQLVVLNNRAVVRGKWPAGDYKVYDALCVLEQMMPAVGVGQDSMFTSAHQIMFTEREAAWAERIACEQKKNPLLEIHVIAGVAHMLGWVADDYLAELGVGVDSLRKHQKITPGPRLWDCLEAVVAPARQ